MVGIKEPVKSAFSFLREIYADQEPIEDIRLEEGWLAEDSAAKGPMTEALRYVAEL